MKDPIDIDFDRYSAQEEEAAVKEEALEQACKPLKDNIRDLQEIMRKAKPFVSAHCQDQLIADPDAEQLLAEIDEALLAQ